jgi:predicted transcriptional regulator
MTGKGDNLMGAQEQSKKEILKDKVVALVVEFVRTEGDITLEDIEDLFGLRGPHEVAIALHKKAVVNFTF